MKKKNIEVRLEITDIQNNGYHVFIDVKIEGGKARMILDTGASKSVLALDFLKNNDLYDEDLEKSKDEAIGIGAEKLETFLYQINKFVLGKATISKFETVVLDLKHINNSYEQFEMKSIDGILGGDFLHEYNAVISYKKKLLKFTLKK
jgi:hypothetical protein